MILNSSDGGAQRKEYTFIAITPRSTLTWRDMYGKLDLFQNDSYSVGWLNAI